LGRRTGGFRERLALFFCESRWRRLILAQFSLDINQEDQDREQDQQPD
jgi:hypothetical protein